MRDAPLDAHLAQHLSRVLEVTYHIWDALERYLHRIRQSATVLWFDAVITRTKSSSSRGEGHCQGATNIARARQMQGPRRCKRRTTVPVCTSRAAQTLEKLPAPRYLISS